jgi:3-phenylpropionate/cinnamic acid dioxygenase small subunit
MAKQILNAAPEVINKGVVGVEQQLRVERFLTYEAALMDEHEYDRWMDLWIGEDITYWLPCNSDDQDPNTGVAIIYDDRPQLLERMMRLKDKAAHAYRPRARLMRTVTDVVPLAQKGNELEIVSNFSLGEIRTGTENIWFGKCHYVLVDTADGFRIRWKKVLLLNNDEPMPNLTFLV